MTETPSTSAESDDEPTATRDANPLESLTDPESLRDRDDVPFTEEIDVLDRETFEIVREGAAVGDGAALVGITNDDGEVLLKDTCTGWLAPGGNVGPDEDWTTVARQQAESWTGVAVELDGVERVRRIDRRLEGNDPSETPDLPFYVVYFRASPATVSSAVDETVAVGSDDDDDGNDSDEEEDEGDTDEDDIDEGDTDEDEPEVEWFDEVPEGVDPSHEDDVRVFFD